MIRYIVPIMAATLALGGCIKKDTDTDDSQQIVQEVRKLRRAYAAKMEGDIFENKNLPKCAYANVEIDAFAANPNKYEGKSIGLTGKIDEVRVNTSDSDSRLTLSLANEAAFAIGYAFQKDTQSYNTARKFQLIETKFKSLQKRGRSVGIQGVVEKGYVNIYHLFDAKNKYLSYRRSDCKK